MEPGVVLMGRGVDYDDLSALKIDTSERHPGDGMEANFTRRNSNLSPSSAKKSLVLHKNTKSLKSTRSKSKKNVITNQQQDKSKKKKNKNDPASYSLDDLALVVRPDDEHVTKMHWDLTVLIDNLKTKLKVSEEHNTQLVEEKMRLSHQLGVQTQVNNELKRLLVASVGDDMQQKYERMIQDKYLADLELRHLHNVLEEDREEVEQAMIQADVWRSKFLASRVMSDELSRWKSVLYYKYRETHTALQSLLEEHSKIRALSNATRKGLVTVIDLLESKDPSLDIEKPLSTMDVAYMNNDLVESICEIMSVNPSNTIHHVVAESDIQHDGDDGGGEVLEKDIGINTCLLTPAESLAQQVVLNPGVQSDELTRMRRDYLAHNRISHFLSTNYHVTFNCCINCKGVIEII